MGYLANRRKVGLLGHSVLAADPDGVPLGLLHQHVWARVPDELGQRELRNKLPTKAKETQRWIDASNATEAAFPPERIVVTVADREADFDDLFAATRREGSHLLIRAKPRRRVRYAENPRLCVLGLSATPVVNILHETRSLLELNTGLDLADIEVDPSVANAVPVHGKLRSHGLRFRPQYAKSVEESYPEVDRTPHLAALRAVDSFRWSGRCWRRSDR